MLRRFVVGGGGDFYWGAMLSMEEETFVEEQCWSRGFLLQSSVEGRGRGNHLISMRESHFHSYFTVYLKEIKDTNSRKHMKTY